MATPVDILIRARDEFSAVTNKAQAEINALAKSNVELGNATVKVSSEANKAGSAFNNLQSGAKRTHASFIEANEAARALGEQIGVQLPRYVSQFLARSSAIGPVLAEAFNALAVVGLISVIAELPEAFKKLEGAITGWDEKAKKAYENLIELNKKAIDRVNELAVAQARIAAPTAEAGEIAALQKSIEIKKAELALQQQRAEALRKQRDAQIANTGAGTVTGAITAPFRPGILTGEDFAKQADEVDIAARATGEAILKLQADLTKLQTQIAAKPTRQFGEELDSLNESFQKTSISSAALGAAVDNAVAQGRSAASIIGQFGKAMEDQQEQAIKSGTAINNAFLPFLAIINTQKELIATNKELDAIFAKAAINADTEANALQSLTIAQDDYNKMLADVPLASAEAARQFNTLLDLINSEEEALQKVNPLFHDLATTIQHFPVRPQPLNLTPTIGTGKKILAPEDWEEWRKKGEAVIKNITDDIGRMFTESIVHGASFWDAFKRLGLDAVSAIVNNFIKGLVGRGLTSLFGSLGPNSSNSILSRLFGLGGSILGGSAVASAAPSAFTQIGGSTLLNTGFAANSLVPAPGALGGPLGFLGLGGGPGLFGLGGATIPVLSGIALGIYGLTKLFEHQTREAPFTRDPNDSRDRTYFFYAANELADASRDLATATKQLKGVNPNDVIVKGLPGALQQSNQFRRDINGVLQDDI